jgi:hypothetical protein
MLALVAFLIAFLALGLVYILMGMSGHSQHKKPAQEQPDSIQDEPLDQLEHHDPWVIGQNDREPIEGFTQDPLRWGCAVAVSPTPAQDTLTPSLVRAEENFSG